MNRQAMFLRSLAVALGTGLAVAVPVFLLHDWFHGSLLPALAIPPNWGDALGTFAIALALFVAQHLVSVAVYRDWEFGRANAEKDAAERNAKVVAAADQVAGELGGLSRGNQGGDRDEAAVPGRQLSPPPDVAVEHLVGELCQAR